MVFFPGAIVLLLRRASFGMYIAAVLMLNTVCLLDRYNPGDPASREFQEFRFLQCFLEPSTCGDVCRMSSAEIVQAENWLAVQSYMRGTIAAGPLNTPIASELPVNITTDGAFNGLVMANDGLLYAVPRGLAQVQVLDPATDTFSDFAIAAIPGPNDFVGGVMGLNNKLYLIPFNRNFVRVIDPVSRTDYEVPSPVTGSTKYASGIRAPDGRIFAIPLDANEILIIDPSTDTVTNIPSPITGAGKWSSGALGPNGLIYGMPSGINKILVIDPVTNSAATLDSPVSGSSLYSGAVLAPNGKLYAIPRQAPSVLVVDAFAGSVHTINISGVSTAGLTKWQGAVLAGDGRIYGIPHDANDILILDPETESISFLAAPVSGQTDKWRLGRTHLNGNIYASQANRDSMLKIEISAAAQFCTSFQQSSYAGP